MSFLPKIKILAFYFTRVILGGTRNEISQTFYMIVFQVRKFLMSSCYLSVQRKLKGIIFSIEFVVAF
jgi:hypothetical protein